MNYHPEAQPGTAAQPAAQPVRGGGPFHGVGLVGGPGAEPRDAGEFSKIFKKFLKKISKMHYFSIFFKKFNKPCVQSFARLDEKQKLFGNFERFAKIFKKFLKKISKNPLF